MNNIFIFIACMLMSNITSDNYANNEELREVIFRNTHKVVKTNGKYIGFLLEENAKIIGFNLVKLGNEQTKITTYTLNSYINIDVKNKDNDLKGLIEVAYLDNNIFTSTSLFRDKG